MSPRVRRAVALVLTFLSVSLATPALQSGASVNQTVLRQHLLRASDLPYGWTLHRSHVSLSIGCLAPLARNASLSAGARANVTFVDGGNPPELTEIVATFASSASAFKRVVLALNHCHVVHGVFAHHALSGRVRSLSFAHEGVASRAYEASASVEGALLFEDVVVIETSKAVVVVAEGNVGAVDQGQLRSFVTLALHRLTTSSLLRK